MPTRAQICAEALSWAGTPYHHGAALKGVGCDCIGFVRGVAAALGCLPPQWTCPVYSSEWHVHQHHDLLVATCEAAGCVRLTLEQAQPGDFLLLQFGKVCSHAAGLLPQPTIIHAARDFGAVVRHHLTGDWVTRLRRAYAFPGVQEACP